MKNYMLFEMGYGHVGHQKANNNMLSQMREEERSDSMACFLALWEDRTDITFLAFEMVSESGWAPCLHHDNDSSHCVHIAFSLFACYYLLGGRGQEDGMGRGILPALPLQNCCLLFVACSLSRSTSDPGSSAAALFSCTAFS